jgi:hypothetical protein
MNGNIVHVHKIDPRCQQISMKAILCYSTGTSMANKDYFENCMQGEINLPHLSF